MEGQVDLVLPFGLAPLRPELRIAGEGLQPGQPVQVGQPPVISQPGGDQGGQAGVGQPEEPARADPVRHVPELLRPHFREVPQRGLGQQPGLQPGHAVDREAAGHGQVGHPDPPLGVLLDQRHPGDAALVARIPGAHVLQEEVIEGVDDLQVAGQQPPEQRHRPGLQGLGQQGVAGVGEGPAGDGPGLLPAHPVLIDQQPHQLGYRQHRVGVVELDDDLVRERLPVAVAEPEPADDVPQRTGDQEILLLEPQFPARLGAVAGVQHLGEVLRAHLRLDRLGVAAGVEQAQVERLPAGPGAPQPQDVDRLGAVARDQHVAGLAPHHLGRHPAGPQPALVILHGLGMPVEPDHLQVIGGGELPRVAVKGPVVGVLDLMAIFEGLLEDPELIPDAVAHGRHVQGGQGVEQAGGQTAQPPVPQPGLHVEILQLPGGVPGRGTGLAGQPGGAGVQRVLPELAAQHVLRRQVVDELRVGLMVRPGRPGPAVSEAVADGDGQRPVGVLGTRRLGRRPPLVTQVVSEVPLELGQRVTRPPALRPRFCRRHEPNLNHDARMRQARACAPDAPAGTTASERGNGKTRLPAAAIPSGLVIDQPGPRPAAKGIRVNPAGREPSDQPRTFPGQPSRGFRLMIVMSWLNPDVRPSKTRAA